MQKQQHLTCLLLLLCTLFSLTACKNESMGSYFSYRKKDFRAEIRGELNGISFTANVGQTDTEDGKMRYVTYLSPEALSGLTVTQNVDGEVSVTLGEITPSGEIVHSLLSSIEALFEGDEILTVQKNAQSTVLQTAPDHTLTLSSSHTPLSFSSPSLTFTVLWWEKI